MSGGRCVVSVVCLDVAELCQLRYDHDVAVGEHLPRVEPLHKVVGTWPRRHVYNLCVTVVSGGL